MTTVTSKHHTMEEPRPSGDEPSYNSRLAVADMTVNRLFEARVTRSDRSIIFGTGCLDTVASADTAGSSSESE